MYQPFAELIWLLLIGEKNTNNHNKNDDDKTVLLDLQIVLIPIFWTFKPCFFSWYEIKY